MSESFSPRPRAGSKPDVSSVDRWPAIEEGFLDLLAECAQIVDLGRAAFVEQRSLTYRAAEAVVIHFDDLLNRLPDDRVARLPAGLSLPAVRRTRNILSHDYRAARKDIVWDVIEQRIPQGIEALLD